MRASVDKEAASTRQLYCHPCSSAKGQTQATLPPHILNVRVPSCPAYIPRWAICVEMAEIWKLKMQIVNLRTFGYIDDRP